MATPKEIVERAIAEHPVVIFSKSYCPYCRKAKAAVAEAGARVDAFAGAHVLELDQRDDGPAIQRYLAEKTGRTTVPSVYIGGNDVGGGDDTAALALSGVLPQMIAAAVHQKRGAATAATAAPAAPAAAAAGEVALFGAGCFWGVELAFQREPGVLRTEVGYANGDREQVSYNEVCAGRSGHAEVVKVWYDAKAVTFERLLALWEQRHDVTSLNRQGNDAGTQYRSAVYYTTDAQQAAAAKWRADANARLGGRVVTDVAPVKTYCAAEASHQQYLAKRGQSAAKGATAAIRCYG